MKRGAIVQLVMNQLLVRERDRLDEGETQSPKYISEQQHEHGADML